MLIHLLEDRLPKSVKTVRPNKPQSHHRAAFHLPGVTSIAPHINLETRAAETNISRTGSRGGKTTHGYQLESDDPPSRADHQPFAWSSQSGPPRPSLVSCPQARWLPDTVNPNSSSLAADEQNIAKCVRIGSRKIQEHHSHSRLRQRPSASRYFGISTSSSPLHANTGKVPRHVLHFAKINSPRSVPAPLPPPTDRKPKNTRVH